MIDISGLEIYDVMVEAHKHSKLIVVSGFKGSRLLTDLEGIGLTLRHKGNNRIITDDAIHVLTGNYEPLALAERIALTWEIEGLKVHRLFGA